MIKNMIVALSNNNNGNNNNEFIIIVVVNFPMHAMLKNFIEYLMVHD